MVFGQPFTLSGRVLGSPELVPKSLVVSLYGAIWGVNKAHVIELATVSVENRAFSYTWTLPPVVSDASDSFEVIPEKDDGPRDLDTAHPPLCGPVEAWWVRSPRRSVASDATLFFRNALDHLVGEGTSLFISIGNRTS